MITLLTGDVRDVLPTLPDASVQCVVTSPPYYALRSYLDASHPDKHREIGSEPTPDAYIATMVRVFREVRRVLRDDGTCWVNLGDSFSGGNNVGWRPGNPDKNGGNSNRDGVGSVPGLAAKQLLMMPARLALALQAPYYTGTIKSEADRIWLAAMIDTEGCMFIHKRKAGTPDYAHYTKLDGTTTSYSRKQDNYAAGLEVANTSQAIVERCMAIVGKGSICSQSPDQNNRRKQTIYRWNLRSNECREVVREVYPHLVAKQQQARILIGCPSFGDKGDAAHRAMIDLHNGVASDVDFPEPASMFEPGWYVRSDIIWKKPNPMPESVTDRPTSAHEHVFLLTKRARYFYDADAVREDSADPVGSAARYEYAFSGTKRIDPNDHQRIVPEGMRQFSGGRNLRNVWSIATAPFPAAHFACVDQETECLTTEGWKRQSDIRPGMLAAQFDLGASKLTWAPIEAVARYNVADQDMIVGSCRDLDMWLTPNHRTVIQRRHPKTRQKQPPRIIRADELLASHTIPTAAEWDFVGDASVPLEWAELLGWYIAEGHQSKDTLAVELYQSEAVNGAKCRRIEELLRQTGAEWTKSTCQLQWRGRPATMNAYRVMGYAAVRLRELAPDKKIPWGATLWSTDRLSALLRGLIAGDGHERLDGRRCFVQKNVEQCGLVQALALRLGYSATVSVRKDGVGVVYITKHTSRSFRGTNGRGSPPQIRRYTGVVWCPKLPQGTWVARRGGKAFITGNTFPPELAERCIRAGSRPGDTILDPFSGAGTALLVADRLGRDAIGIDLNHVYVEMARARLTADCPLFATITDASVSVPPEEQAMADLFAELPL